MTQAVSHKKNILTAGWLLALSALVGTGLMSIVNWHSEPYIAVNEEQFLLRSLNSVISENSYNNNILNDTTYLDDKLLGNTEPTIAYRARLGEQPVAAALTVVTENGYNGEIVLLVGIDFSGKVTGVRVVKHRETPGLGDGIEIKRSNWIETFIGRSLKNPLGQGWKVKRDGGEFDQFTGATITPRAVVGAVHNALLFFNKNKKNIFNQSTLVNKDNQE